MSSARRLAPALCGLSLALILLGCGGALSSGGYLARTSEAVEFLQLTVSGTSLRGTLNAGTLAGSGDSVTTVQATVTGTISGESVTLTFSVGPSWLGGQTSANGTIEGAQLVVTYTQGDGSLASVTFAPSTAKVYDGDLGQLQSQAADVQASESSAAVQAAQTQAQEQQIDLAASRASKDLSTLEDASFSEDLSGLQSDTGDVQSALADEKGDYSQFQSDLASNNLPCADVEGMLEADVRGSVEASVDGAFMPDLEQLQSDIAALRQTIQTASGDVAAYQQAQAGLPSYSPQTPVGALAPALTKAQAVIAKAISSANTLIDQANGYVSQAVQLANQANAAASCGSPITAPSPTADIS